MFSAICVYSHFPLRNLHIPGSELSLVDGEYSLVISELGGSSRFVEFSRQRRKKVSTLSIHALSLPGGTISQRTREESGTIGGRKEKELLDDDLTTGKHPTI